jgi:ribonuclease HII
MLENNFSKIILESGTDEAGRGCLAGPVTAAAVILPFDFENAILNDSKQLSEKTREKLRPIIEQQAISFAVTHLEPLIIDEINILNASIKAMQESILKLHPKP